MPDYRNYQGGYAHFPGGYEGPAFQGLTCGGCAFIVVDRDGVFTCRKAAEMARRPTNGISSAAPACKYWEERK